MTHIVFTSGGVGSWYAGTLVAREHGAANCRFLFTDTRSEDGDLYRFLVESVAATTGRSAACAALVRECRAIPEIGAPGFKDAVAAAQAQARDLLPELVRLSDGRDLWELFADEKMIGNTRVDICSRILKRDTGRKWIEARFAPADCVLYFGIDGSERGRFEGARDKTGIAGRWLPYAARAPLCETGTTKCEMLKECERQGLDPVAIYDEGFPHANCGGFCVKGGQGQFAHLLRTRPAFFAYNARREQEFRDQSGKDVAVLRDRRGGTTKPLPMFEFQRQIESGERVADPRDWGKGCQCFTPDSEATE